LFGCRREELWIVTYPYSPRRQACGVNRDYLLVEVCRLL